MTFERSFSDGICGKHDSEDRGTLTVAHYLVSHCQEVVGLRFTCLVQTLDNIHSIPNGFKNSGGCDTDSSNMVTFGHIMLDRAGQRTRKSDRPVPPATPESRSLTRHTVSKRNAILDVLGVAATWIRILERAICQPWCVNEIAHCEKVLSRCTDLGR